MVAAAGAGPCPQITSTLPLRTSCTITGTSPPGPLRCGSTTCNVNAVATAASKAFPPRSRTAIPTAVPIQWVDVTTPNVPSISGRVVNGLGLILDTPALMLGSKFELSCGSTSVSVNTALFSIRRPCTLPYNIRYSGVANVIRHHDSSGASAEHVQSHCRRFYWKRARMVRHPSLWLLRRDDLALVFSNRRSNPVPAACPGDSRRLLACPTAWGNRAWRLRRPRRPQSVNAGLDCPHDDRHRADGRHSNLCIDWHSSADCCSACTSSSRICSCRRIWQRHGIPG